jgi:thioredoxin reductase (NADPH)
MQLTVYSRLYCHLCEDLLARLEALRPELGFDYEVRDVDEDPALRARYHALVPLLAAGEREICHHFLDEQALRHYLEEA